MFRLNALCPLRPKFAMDQEAAFRLLTNKLVGTWAGEQLGLTGGELDSFLSHFLEDTIKVSAKEEIKQRILSDFAANNIEITEHAIEKVFRKMAAKAHSQMMQ
jgi:hypothetical protein